MQFNIKLVAYFTRDGLFAETVASFSLHKTSFVFAVTCAQGGRALCRRRSRTMKAWCWLSNKSSYGRGTSAMRVGRQSHVLHFAYCSSLSPSPIAGIAGLTLLVRHQCAWILSAWW